MRKIKQGIVIVGAMLLCACWQVQAQEQEADVFPRHHAQVAVGDPVLLNLTSNLLLTGHYGLLSGNLSIDRNVSLPVFSVSYYYAFNKWLQVGGDFFYSGIFKQASNKETGDTYGPYAAHALCIQPVVRFEYINRERFGMYSSLATGLFICSDHGEYFKETREEKPTRYTTFLPTFQVTCAGFRFGNKVYGLLELGVGSRGFVTAGIGSRF